MEHIPLSWIIPIKPTRTEISNHMFDHPRASNRTIYPRNILLNFRTIHSFWPIIYTIPISYICIYFLVEVSINGGTPQSSILIVFSLINHLFWGTPMNGNPHMPTYVIIRCKGTLSHKCSWTPPGSAAKWLISSMRMVSPLKVRPRHWDTSREVEALSLYLSM